MDGEDRDALGGNKAKEETMEHQSVGGSKENTNQVEDTNSNTTRESKKRKADGTPEIDEVKSDEEEREFFLKDIEKLSQAINGIFQYVGSIPQSKIKDS